MPARHNSARWRQELLDPLRFSRPPKRGDAPTEQQADPVPARLNSTSSAIPRPDSVAVTVSSGAYSVTDLGATTSGGSGAVDTTGAVDTAVGGSATNITNVTGAATRRTTICQAASTPARLGHHHHHSGYRDSGPKR